MSRRIGTVEVGALALVVGQLLPWPVGLAGLAMSGPIALALARSRRWRGAAVAGGVLACGAMVAGGSLLAWWGHAVPAGSAHVRHLPLPWRGMVEAVVVDGPWRFGTRERMTIEVRRARRGTAWERRSGRVLVTAYDALPEALEPGRRFRARLSIRAPRGFRNQGSFDWVGHLARRGVHATGALPAGTPVDIATTGVEGGAASIARWRRRVAARIDGLAADPDARAVLQAVVVGHRGGVSHDVRDRFVRAGVAHVLAISGLHVGIVAGVVTWLASRLLLATAGGASRIDPRAVARLVACAPALLYCALGGFGPSVARAGAALVVVAVATAGDRRPDGLRVVAVVALLLSLLDPGVARDVGFQLSLAAVVGLVLGARRRGGWVRRAFTASWGAWAATAPVLAHHFQELSFAGLVAGPLLIPFFGVPPIAFGVLGAILEPVRGTLADACLGIAARLLGPGLWSVEHVARLPGAALRVPRPSAAEVAGLYTILAALAGGVPRRLRWVALVMAVAILADVAWWTWVRTGRGRLVVTFLDVGQGDAAIVELPDGAVMVVDGGGFPGSDFDVGRAVVAPQLRARKIGRIDVVVATHAHPDHFGGLRTVIEHFRPAELWWPGGPGGSGWRRLERVARRRGVHVRTVATSAVRELGGARIRVVHPPPGWGGSTNDRSVVLEIGHAGRRILLTGDVEASGERAIVDLVGRRPADVVKIPHHGSRTSSTARFVRATGGGVAVASLGADNRYGHPAPEVETRWRRAGTCLLRTDRCGSVTVTIAADGGLTVAAWEAACRCPPSALTGSGRSPS